MASELTPEQLWQADKDASVHGAGYGETWAEEPIPEHYRRMASNLLPTVAAMLADAREAGKREGAAEVRAQLADAWDGGFIARTGDTPRYAKHAEWGNPYRAALTDPEGTTP